MPHSEYKASFMRAWCLQDLDDYLFTQETTFREMEINAKISFSVWCMGGEL